MQNIGEVVDGQFVDELLENLKSIGVPLPSIQAILIEGSALYLDHPNGIDFKVIVEYCNPKAEVGRSFNIKGYKVECTHYTLEEWNSVDSSTQIFYYVTESPDMILVYGNDEGLKRFDVVRDRDLARKVLAFYDKYLFNAPQESVRGRGGEEAVRIPKKRLWNFLLFAYKIINGSHALTSEQLQAVQDAHDLKSTVEEYRNLFDRLQAVEEAI